jgi:hypothetical protein
MRCHVQLIHDTAVAASSRLAVFRRSLQPAAANHVARGQPRRARGVRGNGKPSFLSHINENVRHGNSDVSREGAAANAGARCIRVDEYQIHIMGIATFSSQVSSPVLAASGAGLTAACGHSPIRLQPDWWRLDFQALSSKTARTVARDGCERGLAVHSVRS